MWCDWNSMGVFGWTMMVALWGGLFAVVLWIIRSAQGHKGGELNAALKILEHRFAAGDIEHEEFEERKRVLLDRLGSRT